MKRNIILIICIFIVWLFLSNCVGYQNKIDETTKASVSSITPSTIATSTKIELVTPTIHVIISPTVTPTKDITKTITPTNLPPLPENGLEAIRLLYKDNGGCELPCWWGIKPGETTIQQFKQRFSFVENYFENENRFGKLYEPFIKVMPELDDKGEIKPLLITKGDVINGMIINSKWVQKDLDPTLAALLTYLGKPDEIWINAFGIIADEKYGWYNIDLFYSQKGILIDMAGYLLPKNNNDYMLCPQRSDLLSDTPGLFLWNPNNNKITLKTLSGEVFMYLSGLTFEYSQEVQPLEKLNPEYTPEKFYDTFTNAPASKCIEINVGEKR
jgi:hypothetical protein